MSEALCSVFVTKPYMLMEHQWNIVDDQPAMYDTRNSVDVM